MYSENSNILDERRPIMDTKKIGAFIAMNRKKKGYTHNVIKLRNDGFEENTKNVLLFFLWKI